MEPTAAPVLNQGHIPTSEVEAVEEVLRLFGRTTEPLRRSLTTIIAAIETLEKRVLELSDIDRSKLLTLAGRQAHEADRLLGALTATLEFERKALLSS